MLDINSIDNSLLLKIIDESSYGFLIVDNEYNIEYAFNNACELLNIGKNLKNLNFKAFLENSSIDLEINKPLLVNLKSLNNNFFKAIITVYVYDNKYLIVKIAKDLSENKQLEVKYVENSWVKMHVLSSLSHDFKTPIQSINGFAQALLGDLFGELSQPQKKYISIISKNADKLLRMINNSTDYCKCEVKRLAIETSKFRVADFIKTLNDVVPELAGKKAVECNFVTEDLQLTEICTDKIRLHQIIINLLELSITFVDDGVINVTFSHPEKTIIESLNLNKPPESLLLVTIQDNGKGVEDNEKDIFFEVSLFDKTNKTRKYGISGINLALCKNLVEKLGGKIWLENDTSEGVTIKFVLPVDSLVI